MDIPGQQIPSSELDSRLERLGIQSMVDRLTSRADVEPMVVKIADVWLGYAVWSRTIFCPLSWVKAIPSDELEALLAHEVIHDKHQDEIVLERFKHRFPKQPDRAEVAFLASQRLKELRTDREALTLGIDPEALIRALRRIEPWRIRAIERGPAGRGVHPPLQVRECNIRRHAGTSPNAPQC
jgi:hypothetical protein